jgi:spore germination cell wall hydrolase CwlJ-like protein
MLTAFVRATRLLCALALLVPAFAVADEVVKEIEPGLYLFESGRVGMKPVADHPDEADATATVEIDAASTDEAHCLATAIYFEARGESARGQRAVADVVLARVRTPGRPKSICGVVYEGSHRRTGCQFSFTCDRHSDVARPGLQWSRAQRIAAAAIAGEAEPVVHGATFYHAEYVKPRWARRMVRVAQIGSHIFYRPKRGRLL